jgi:uncharacterized protein CbrC (UPF0167 family)
MERLGDYSILMNDDHELMLVLPGYFKGDAAEPVFWYNGGAHAILVRNKHQCIVCDDLNEAVRPWVLQNEHLLVLEADSKRKYVASVAREDIDDAAEEAIALHRYHFDYHPFPLLDGTFDIGKARCDYCGAEVRVYYRGPLESGRRVTVCPQCIDRLEPAQRGDSLFPGMAEACMVRPGLVFGDTPPYLDQGGVATLWAAHCGEPSVYLGALEPEDLIPELKDELLETWDNPFNRFRADDPEETFSRFERDALTAHLFRCAKCKQELCIFYERKKSRAEPETAPEDEPPVIPFSEFYYGHVQGEFADSFLETCPKLTVGRDGSVRITELVGGREYTVKKVVIDPEGRILEDGGIDYVKQLKDADARIVLDRENLRDPDWHV